MRYKEENRIRRKERERALSERRKGGKGRKIRKGKREGRKGKRVINEYIYMIRLIFYTKKRWSM